MSLVILTVKRHRFYAENVYKNRILEPISFFNITKENKK